MCISWGQRGGTSSAAYGWCCARHFVRPSAVWMMLVDSLCLCARAHVCVCLRAWICVCNRHGKCVCVCHVMPSISWTVSLQTACLPFAPTLALAGRRFSRSGSKLPPAASSGFALAHILSGLGKVCAVLGGRRLSARTKRWPRRRGLRLPTYFLGWGRFAQCSRPQRPTPLSF